MVNNKNLVLYMIFIKIDALQYKVFSQSTSDRIGGAVIWKIENFWKNHCLKENLKKITAGWVS